MNSAIKSTPEGKARLDAHDLKVHTALADILKKNDEEEKGPEPEPQIGHAKALCTLIARTPNFLPKNPFEPLQHAEEETTEVTGGRKFV